jgi:hypothetical protein
MVPRDQTSDVQFYIGESLGSGFAAEPVIGRAFARPVGAPRNGISISDFIIAALNLAAPWRD